MHTTFHAAERIRQRSISEEQVELVLEHGAWNSRGDRLTLGSRQVKALLSERRRELRALNGCHQRRSRILARSDRE